jgi:hypothetical protein
VEQEVSPRSTARGSATAIQTVGAGYDAFAIALVTADR